MKVVTVRLPDDVVRALKRLPNWTVRLRELILRHLDELFGAEDEEVALLAELGRLQERMDLVWHATRVLLRHGAGARAYRLLRLGGGVVADSPPYNRAPELDLTREEREIVARAVELRQQLAERYRALLARLLDHLDGGGPDGGREA